jgi:hypothetical protein
MWSALREHYVTAVWIALNGSTVARKKKGLHCEVGIPGSLVRNIPMEFICRYAHFVVETSFCLGKLLIGLK